MMVPDKRHLRKEKCFCHFAADEHQQRARRSCTEKHSYVGRSLAPEKNPEPARNPGFLSRCLIFCFSSGGRGVGGSGCRPICLPRLNAISRLGVARRQQDHFMARVGSLKPPFPLKGSKVMASASRAGGEPAAFGHYVPRCGIGLWSSTRTFAPGPALFAVQRAEQMEHGLPHSAALDPHKCFQGLIGEWLGEPSGSSAPPFLLPMPGAPSKK